jgi:predicted N-acetyltransferase YhbS
MYQFHRVTVDKDNIVKCSNLLKEVFPQSDNFTYDYIKWEYADNPAGNIIGFNAFDGDELAAHYVTQPVIANVFGKEMKGLLSLNTATHPNHQGKKLFVTLADMTYKYAAEHGYSFVFGVANTNSTPGFIKKLGFQLAAPLIAKVGIGEIKTDNTKKQFCFERVWTSELLNWRIKNPIHKYSVSGNNIYAPTGKYGISAIMGNFDRNLFKNVSLQKKSSLNPLKLYMGLDSSIKWGKSKYFEIPEKLRPSPLNLIFKDLLGNNMKLDAASVKFRAVDFDAY